MRDLNMARKAGRAAAYLIPAVILIIFLFRERSPFGGRNTSFAVNAKREITRIDLTEGLKNVELVKKGDEWLVNGKTEARRSALLFMLKILNEMQIKSTVSQEVFKNEITGKSIAPVRVKVFQKGKPVKSFLVYRTGSNNFGNIMKLRATSKPFIVYVPGIEAEIGTCFSTDEFYWQPFTLFNLLPSEISSIALENVQDQAASFTVRIKGNKFSLGDSGRELSGWDTSRIVRYVSYFTHVPFEAPASGMEDSVMDAIENDFPHYRLTVEKNNGEIIRLILWDRWNEENDIRTKDTDRLWAKINDRDELFVVRYMDIDPILKKRSYFFPG